MKTWKLFNLVWISAALITIGYAATIKGNAAQLSEDKGFAVVELFTSEGCSSCPPADQLLAKIQKESNGKPVYILAYHVDYWNRLGWKDVFSDHAYSERQQQYSRWLNSNQVYTPQAIVNGKKEFIGSEEGTLRNAIKNGLQYPSAAHLQLSGVKASNGHVEVQYHTDAFDNDNVLVVAVVQKSGVSNVKRGENGGRTLSHVQIVRNLKTVALHGKGSGSAVFDLAAGLNAQNAELIAFVQNVNNGAISAAARTPLNNIDIVNASSLK